MIDQIKDAGMHYEKLVTDADLLLEKVQISMKQTAILRHWVEQAKVWEFEWRLGKSSFTAKPGTHTIDKEKPV